MTGDDATITWSAEVDGAAPDGDQRHAAASTAGGCSLDTGGAAAGGQGG